MTAVAAVAAMSYNGRRDSRHDARCCLQLRDGCLQRLDALLHSRDLCGGHDDGARATGTRTRAQRRDLA